MHELWRFYVNKDGFALGLGTGFEIVSGSEPKNSGSGSTTRRINVADSVALPAFLTAGEWCSYSQADMPAHVKAKLGQIPLILEQLMAAGHHPKRNIHT